MKKYDKISIFQVLASNKLQPQFHHKLVRQTSFVWTTTFVCFTLNQITPIQRKRTEITYSWDGRCSISRNNKTHFSNWHESFFVRKMNLRKKKLVKRYLSYLIEFVGIVMFYFLDSNNTKILSTLINFWYNFPIF